MGARVNGALTLRDCVCAGARPHPREDRKGQRGFRGDGGGDRGRKGESGGPELERRRSRSSHSSNKKRGGTLKNPALTLDIDWDT